MGYQTIPQLQDLIDHMRSGDEGARVRLVGCAFERFVSIARRMFHHQFPRLQNVHDTDSIANAASLRLLTALQEVKPNNVAQFWGLAVKKIRETLLDLAKRKDRRKEFVVESRDGHGEDGTSGNSAYDPADNSTDPVKQAMYAEFMEKVLELPDEEREVFDLYFLGYAQATIAGLINLHPKEVNRRWLSAKRKMAKWVPDW